MVDLRPQWEMVHAQYREATHNVMYIILPLGYVVSHKQASHKDVHVLTRTSYTYVH